MSKRYFPEAGLPVILTALALVLCNVGESRAQDKAPQDIPDAIVRKVDPSVVAIQHERAVGSGFVISPDGYILSNGHVVRGNDPDDPSQPAKSIVVILNDERKFPAKVLGFCMNPDVSLLKIEVDTPLEPVEFADSEQAQIGQKCFAVGTPQGLKRTFTSGMLSNVTRTDLGTFTAVLQTDAAINPGNSGGPLFDREGRVLGINTYASRGSNNLGFTIPSHVVQVLRDHLMEHGRFVRSDVPIFFASEIYDELGRALQFNHGILVDYVMKGSSAGKAGLRQGDILVAIDGEPVSARTQAEMRAINWAFTIRKPGTPITLVVMRGAPGAYEEVTLRAVLEETEPEPATRRWPGEQKIHQYETLGLKYHEIVKLQRVHLGLSDAPGVIVKSAGKNSAASKADLRTGYIITAVEGEPVGDVASFETALEKALTAHDKVIVLDIEAGKLRFKTALAPFYDLAEQKIAIIASSPQSEYLDLIRRELLADGAQLAISFLEDAEAYTAQPPVPMTGLKGEDIDILLLLDGTGSTPIWENEELLRIVREANAAEKKLTAVGSAALALIAADEALLEKKMTTSKQHSGEAARRKARYTGNEVEKDGNVLTTTGFDRDTVREFIRQLRAYR